MLRVSRRPSSDPCILPPPFPPAVIHVIDEVLLPIDLAAAQEAEAADTEAPPAQEAEATSGASSALASLAALAASVAAAALML